MASPGQPNVLWIMCDQLRHDYLGCTGHPHIKTPNIDWIARDGVRFSRAFAQSTICGSSRMSAYTGRYMHSHGSTGNEVPLRIGEMTLGDHLAELGGAAVLVGKTHMRPDEAGMARLGVDPGSDIAVRAAEAGFYPFARHDGLHPYGDYDPNPPYGDFLREQGLTADNLWESYANGAEGDDGSVVSGWLMENAGRPARVPAEMSETAWTTQRAMDFIDGRGPNDAPWCLHLSYIKPHWPYLAPAPYHQIYGPSDVVPAVRDEAERADPHPLYAAFLQERYSQVFCRDEVRERVIPAYMGLIQEVDDHLGRLFDFLRERGQLDSTLIIFSTDHGDYLGDHWLGEKYLFHDPSVRVPLLLRDPRPQADATRGQTLDALAEMIDLAPTIVDFMAGGEAAAARDHILQGRSLLPRLAGETSPAWRACAFSEYDFTYDAARLRLGTPVEDSCATMVFDGRWKYIHVPEHAPLLYDLKNDPHELRDLGRQDGHGEIIARLKEAMFDWCRKQANRVTISRQGIAGGDAVGLAYDRVIDHKIYIGFWDQLDIEAEEAKRAAALQKDTADAAGEHPKG